MFTLEQIESAHAKTSSGADFPQYIRDIKELGVIRFQTFVSDCHTLYFGVHEFISSEGKYNTLEINGHYDKEWFEQWLKDNQKWRNSFFEFCQICAWAGVDSWVMDLEEMKCIYYDKKSNIVLIETVPA